MRIKSTEDARGQFRTNFANFGFPDFGGISGGLRGEDCGDRLTNTGLEEADEEKNRGKNGYWGPIGTSSFIEKLETLVGRCLKIQKPGRKTRNT